MISSAAQLDLISADSIPTREVEEDKLSRQEKIRRRNQWFRDMLASKGFLYPVPLVAEILGVSHQRVCQLIEQGHLELIKVRSSSYVAENSLITYSKLELKGGRPPKIKTVSDCLALAKSLPEKM